MTILANLISRKKVDRDPDTLPQIDPRLLDLEREIIESGHTLDDTISREMALRMRQRRQEQR